MLTEESGNEIEVVSPSWDPPAASAAAAMPDQHAMLEAFRDLTTVVRSLKMDVEELKKPAATERAAAGPGRKPLQGLEKLASAYGRHQDDDDDDEDEMDDLPEREVMDDPSHPPRGGWAAGLFGGPDQKRAVAGESQREARGSGPRPTEVGAPTMSSFGNPALPGKGVA